MRLKKKTHRSKKKRKEHIGQFTVKNRLITRIIEHSLYRDEIQKEAETDWQMKAL